LGAERLRALVGPLPVLALPALGVFGDETVFVEALAFARLAGRERGVAGAFALAGSLAVAEVSAATASRAAVRLGVERCGRVRGKLDSSPATSCGLLGRPLLSLGTLTSTSLLNGESAAREKLLSDLGADPLA
jgi:hypothetical protein